MTKQVSNNKNSNTTKTTKKSSNVAKKKKSTKIVSKSKNSKKKASNNISSKKHNFIMGVVIFSLGVLLIFSTYAWLSTSLNVKIKNFNMVVSRNSGLSISLDGITFGTFIEISEENLINKLKNTYPNNTSQWSGNGLVPVSTNGISNPNSTSFDIYASTGVRYKSKKKDNGYVTTFLVPELERSVYNSYIAFDIFLKNITGSPVSDNLYLDYTSYVVMDSDSDEEMQGLVNSARVGFLKMGTVDKKAPVNLIQNIGCNNNCSVIIYEPNSKDHTNLSMERAMKYGINLISGEEFPTYACIRGGGPIYVKSTVSGSADLDRNYFALQNTITEDDFANPLFKIPDGITKVRVYVWIEGQDIDSLETDSEGADISISLDLTKDTVGYNTFDE